jgi:predicted PurR-regulated permease PerM
MTPQLHHSHDLAENDKEKSMNDQENSNQPIILVLLSAMIFGLASFVVWLLRLGPGAQKKSEISRPARPTQDSTMGRTETPEIMAASQNAMIQADQLPVADQEADLEETQLTGWTTPTRYLAGVGIFLFFLWLISYSQQTLSLLVFAALIAILAQPVSNFFQKRLRFSRGLAITITYLLVAVLIVVVPLLLIPNITNGINSLLSYDWQSLIDAVTKTLDQSASQISSIPLIGNGIANSLTGLSQLAQGLVTSKPDPVATDSSATLNHLGKTIGVFGNLVGPLVSGIISLVFMLLISLQISLSGDQIRGWIINPVPPRFKTEISHLLQRVQLVWVSFLHGEFTLMIVMGLVTWLLNVILGTPHAAMLGFLAGLMEVVPSLGPIIATIPAAILALIFGSTIFTGLNPWIFMLIVILGYVLLQLIENQVLVPKILGSAVSLPPLIVLVGVTIAGAQAGIVGVFLATPIMATGKVILNFVYEKVIAASEPEPPEEDQTSMMDQMGGFLKKLHWPTRHEGQSKQDAS